MARHVVFAFATGLGGVLALVSSLNGSHVVEVDDPGGVYVSIGEAAGAALLGCFVTLAIR